MKIEIYDPPICCPSGICGPEVDDFLKTIFIYGNIVDKSK